MSENSRDKTNPTSEHDPFQDSSFFNKFQECSFLETSTSSNFNHLHDSANKSALNVSALCCDEEISGYDKLTGKTWIYPTNYPVRDYQFNIIRAAIVKNTLVSLPTGLGKTFIAAVIMYNFYRWYPLGKIVFMAPTRPLVAQQIDACYNIIAIPQDDSIEMTGHMQANTRKVHWQQKRVFFATPQVIYNDIKSGICPSDKIKCLVFDEAHRARGNYAYCQIVGTLTDMGHKTYRILALSATPGSKVDDVVNVVKNLHIAHLELRTEYCIDVAPYSHTRRVDTVVIPLGPELTQLREHYVEILDFYARRLKQMNILPYNIGNLSKGRIVMLYKEFQTKERGQRHPQHNYIMKDFTNLIALYHGLELLTKHGSRVFLNFFDEHPEKGWIQADDRLTLLLERLRDDMGVNPLALDRSILPDGSVPEIPKDIRFGHPKFDKLRELMMAHFKESKEKNQDTRAIVFCEYRESVNLVHCLLLQCRPLIKPLMFVGQGGSGKEGKAGVSQKQQVRAMRSFREGAANALVATCVAEEGLDVGSVDLILCFDISTRSPIRLVQRCGRTGRERGGKVHILVTEGREHQTLLDCIRQRDGLNKKIIQSTDVKNNLYKLNPRMMPHDFMPECRKMYITVQKKNEATDKNKDAKTGQKDLRNMLLSRASYSGSSSSSREYDVNNFISKADFDDLYPEGFQYKPYFESSKEFLAMDKDAFKRHCNQDAAKCKLTPWLEWQRSLQKTINVGHTRDSEILSELLASADSKRFEMPPSTQNPTFDLQQLNTQALTLPSPHKTVTVKKKTKPAQSAKLTSNKDGDIRALFSTATKSTKNYTKLINDLGIQSNGTLPTPLIDLLVDLTLENTNAASKCYICTHVCDCKIFLKLENEKKQQSLLFLNSPIFPDIKLIEDIEIDVLINYNNISKHNVDESVLNKTTSNFDLEFDFSGEEIVSPQPDVIEKLDVIENFDLGHIEDIFDESSPEEVKDNEIQIDNDQNSSKPKEALEFFGLDSIEDIFADSDCEESQRNIENNETLKELDDENVNLNKTENCDIKNIDDCIVTKVDVKDHKPIEQERPSSPSLLSGTVKAAPCSPILCSQVKKFNLSTKPTQIKCSTPIINKAKSLFKEPKSKDTTSSDIKIDSQQKSSIADKSQNKSLFTITQLVEMINKTGEDSATKHDTVFNENLLNEMYNDDRSMSPILLTQSERTKVANTSLHKPKPHKATKINNKPNLDKSIGVKSTSLIVLDSDSDSDSNETIVYEAETVAKQELPNSPEIEFKSPLNSKRKLSDDGPLSASPYFNKKIKLDNDVQKPLSLQEKIIAALSTNDINKTKNKDNHLVNLLALSPVKNSQKENIIPDISKRNEISKITDVEDPSSPLEKLKMFQRNKTFGTKLNSPTKLSLSKTPATTATNNKPSNTLSDSDDDFIVDNHKKDKQNRVETKSLVNHKMRKKAKRKLGNSFLDVEAELSDGSGRDSGDELSDESVGSIIDFICDDDAVNDKDDMYAHYVRSVKNNPVNGVFKIPELPNKFRKEEIFSQYVEEDESYQMDSFCVDSHIGLTQVNEVSEVELAEQMLEKRRKARRKREQSPELKQSDADSPIAKRVNKLAKRRISSDSD